MAGLHITRFDGKISSSKLVEHKKILFDFLFWPPFQTKERNLYITNVSIG